MSSRWCAYLTNVASIHELTLRRSITAVLLSPTLSTMLMPGRSFGASSSACAKAASAVTGV